MNSKIGIKGFFTVDVKTRFMSKISKSPDGCWLWTGSKKEKNKYKYGYFWMNGKVHSAHRASFMLFIGSITSGLFVCHKCDVPECVNPSHLFIGDNSANMLNASSKNRHGAQIHKKKFQEIMRRNHRAFPGEKHWASKLTEKNVKYIKDSFVRTGYRKSNRYELASKFMVSTQSIMNIVNGHNWKHLNQIKGVGGKLARETLAKIKEVKNE